MCRLHVSSYLIFTTTQKREFWSDKNVDLEYPLLQSFFEEFLAVSSPELPVQMFSFFLLFSFSSFFSSSF